MPMYQLKLWLKASAVQNASQYDVTIMLSVADACYQVTIRNNTFIGTVATPASANTNAIKFLGASNYSKVIGNNIYGQFSAAAIAASAAASTAMIISDNVVNNADTTAGLTIVTHDSTTGMAVRNLCLGGKNTIHLTLAGMLDANNYDTNAAGASAIIMPAVDS